LIAPYSENHSIDFYKKLPKVELHRHLEGSLRLNTMLEVAHKHGLDLPTEDPPYLKSLVQINHWDPLTFENFLSKFDTIRLFYRSPEVIRRVTREAIADAAEDNIRYFELRFTPVALSKVGGFPMEEVMDWVITTAKEASKKYGVKTRLIASVNRHESTDLAEEVAQIAVDRMKDGIVALDLAGNEAEFSAEPFAVIFKEAKKAGLGITIHAGEWGNATNIIEAIEIMNADRIGHGVRVFENPRAVTIAKERNIPFEVCPTSNYQSGVISSLDQHPLPKMLESGLNVTLNTDDPSISGIVLSDEYYLFCSTMALPLQMLHSTVLNAAKAAFMNNGDINSLAQQISKEFSEKAGDMK